MAQSNRTGYMVCVSSTSADSDAELIIRKLQKLCRGAARERIEKALSHPPFSFRRMSFDAAQSAKADLERLGCVVDIREQTGAVSPAETVLWEKEEPLYQARFASGVDEEFLREQTGVFTSKDAAVEAYRTFRTNLLVKMKEEDTNTFVFTSALPKEGKSVTVANVGISLANTGKNTLLVDLDLRSPTLHTYFGVDSSIGITNIVLDSLDAETAISRTVFDRLNLLPSGPLQPNPSEILSSSAVKELMGYLSNKFDVVLLDSPPVIGLTDSVVIGSIISSVFMVVRSGYTPRQQAELAVRMLENVNCRIHGVVLNEVDMAKTRYGLYGYTKSTEK